MFASHLLRNQCNAIGPTGIADGALGGSSAAIVAAPDRREDATE
jgi:hypothetical protein